MPFALPSSVVKVATNNQEFRRTQPSPMPPAAPAPSSSRKRIGRDGDENENDKIDEPGSGGSGDDAADADLSEWPMVGSTVKVCCPPPDADRAEFAAAVADATVGSGKCSSMMAPEGMQVEEEDGLPVPTWHFAAVTAVEAPQRARNGKKGKLKKFGQPSENAKQKALPGQLATLLNILRFVV